MKCPYQPEFGKWIECPQPEKAREGYCDHHHHIAKGGSWCGKTVDGETFSPREYDNY